MLHKAIHILLITLIASQSVLAFADTHQFEMSVIEHVSPETHDHHENDMYEIQDEQHSQDDCNHCCHCHGQTNPFLSKVLGSIKFASLANLCPDYLFSNTSFLDSPDNPPPIY